MNAWINEIAGQTGIGPVGIDFSLSDMSHLVPDARLLWILGAVVVFYLVTAFDDKLHSHYFDQDSDADQR